MTRNPTTPTSRDQPKALYHRPPCASRTMRRTGAAVTLGVAGTRGAGGACPHSCAAVLWGARAVRQPCARAFYTRPPAERGRQPRVAFSVAMVPPVGNASRCLHPASNCRDARHLHPQLRLPVVGGNKGGTVHFFDRCCLRQRFGALLGRQQTVAATLPPWSGLHHRREHGRNIVTEIPWIITGNAFR